VVTLVSGTCRGSFDVNLPKVQQLPEKRGPSPFLDWQGMRQLLLCHVILNHLLLVYVTASLFLMLYFLIPATRLEIHNLSLSPHHGVSTRNRRLS
jgi:hypothetical protein